MSEKCSVVCKLEFHNLGLEEQFAFTIAVNECLRDVCEGISWLSCNDVKVYMCPRVKGE